MIVSRNYSQQPQSGYKVETEVPPQTARTTMSNKILCLLTATSLSLIALSAHAFDPSKAVGNQQRPQMSGNDQNRKAIEGMSILGGGPRKVDANSANARAFAAMNATYGGVNIQKQEADKYYKAGIAFMNKGNYVQAAASVKLSLNIRETYFAASDPVIPEVKERLADIYAAEGKSKEALDAYSAALISYAKFNGPGTAHRIRPLTAMGSIQLKESNFKGALDCYNQAYMLTLRAKGLNSPEAMRLRLQLASVNKAAKSYDLAASIYNECFDLQKKNEKLIETPQLISALQDYASVLQALKRDDEAAKILARAKVLSGGGAEPVAAEASDGKTSAESKAEAKPPEVTSTEVPASPAK